MFEDKQGRTSPVLLEIDRGMEYQKRFKQHVKARIEFIRSGKYAQLFEIRAVMIAYATTGQRPEYRDSRRKTMCNWTMEVLEELSLEKWSGVFRFASIEFGGIYDLSLFEKPVWYAPDEASPVTLIQA